MSGDPSLYQPRCSCSACNPYTLFGGHTPAEAPDAHWVQPMAPVQLLPHQPWAALTREEAMRERLGLLNEDDLALLLGVTVKTIGIWRGESQGPDYVKLGQKVFYLPADVKTWAARQTVQLNHHG